MLETKKIVIRGISSIVLVLFAIFVNWIALPARTFHSDGFWWYLIVIAFAGVCIFGIAEFFEDDNCYMFTKISAVVMLFLIICWCVLAMFSSTLFNAKKYAKLIEVEEGNFEEDFRSVVTEELITLDMTTAQQLGSRVIGNLENISRYSIDEEYNLVAFNGEYHRVTPLEYGGVFKALNNSAEGLPAYVTVDATKNKAQMVELEDEMKYSSNAFGKYKLKRHLRREYPDYIFGKEQFEIDDEGNPYYIVPVMEINIGMFGGKTVKSFIILNPVNGDIDECDVDELPNWVDHAYSLGNLMSLAESYYGLKEGFWASVIDGSGVYNISYEYANSEDIFDGYSSIVINGEICFLTGVVSASNDESMIGFITANSRTGEFKFYDCVGAEEGSGMGAAEALVQNFGYLASQPVIVNVDGHETYFMMLKDKTLNNKGFAFVNIKDYTKAVQAETIEEAIQLYRNKIGTADATTETEPKEEKSTEGAIAVLYEAIKSGSTNYFFRLEGDEILYVSPIENNQKQVEMKVGDRVAIKYSSTDEDGVGVVSEITIE